MSKTQDVVMVFTARSAEAIVAAGGSYSWATRRARAQQCEWVVCAQNRRHPDPQFADGREPHGSAFFIGRMAAVLPSPDPDYDDRWMFAISEWAPIQIRSAWKGWRNPVHYTSVDELGIDLGDLQFEPLAPPTAPPNSNERAAPELARALANVRRFAATELQLDPAKVRILIEA